jgi:hypothetical protein
MKKVVSIILAPVFTVALLAGCAGKDKAASSDGTGIVKLGLGQSTSIAKSKDADGADVTALGQVDTVIAAVGFDKDGKVVSVTIDTAQTKVQFNKDLSLKSDVKEELKTKVELGDAYGMKKNSKLGKEWHEQIAELEKWMVGKSIDEIKKMKTTTSDDKVLTDEADLKSSVSVGIADYLAVVEEAYKNAVEVKGGTKVGLGHEISIAKSKGLTADKAPLAQVDTVMMAAAFDKDGKVAGAILDTAQTKINFDNAGKLTTDKKAELKTKVELGDEYGMKKNSKIGKEWHEQAKALTTWMTGKSVADITGMKTTTSDDKVLTDVAELKSSVSVGVADYLATLEEASKNAR